MVISFLIPDFGRVRFITRNAPKPTWKELADTNSSVGIKPSGDLGSFNYPQWIEVDLDEKLIGWAVLFASGKKGLYELKWALPVEFWWKGIEERLVESYRDLAMTMQSIEKIAFTSPERIKDLIPTMQEKHAELSQNGLCRFELVLDRKKSAQNW